MFFKKRTEPPGKKTGSTEEGRQKFKKNCSSATHCCRRLAASGHDDFSLHSAKLESLSSHLQLGRPRRRRGFVTKFSFQSSSGLQEAAKIGHVLVLEAKDVASRNCGMKFHSCFQSFIHSPHVGTPVFCPVARPAND